jgi:hypothetical protein
MPRQHAEFAFFMPTERRSLRQEERAVVERLLQGQGTQYTAQLDGLMVVGRCGCGACPTVFFQAHVLGDQERDIVSMAGQDATGSLVGAVLLERQGVLSQLEFFSVDGHDPWEVPDAQNLAPF